MPQVGTNLDARQVPWVMIDPEQAEPVVEMVVIGIPIGRRCYNKVDRIRLQGWQVKLTSVSCEEAANPIPQYCLSLYDVL